jgi:hypothetical protein
VVKVPFCNIASSPNTWPLPDKPLAPLRVAQLCRGNSCNCNAHRPRSRHARAETLLAYTPEPTVLLPVLLPLPALSRRCWKLQSLLTSTPLPPPQIPGTCRAAASAASVRSRFQPSADAAATSGGTCAVRYSTSGMAPTCKEQPRQQ